ncbi:MAG: hypothetical protein ACRDOO_22535, partial [Actinomadura sp.]
MIRAGVPVREAAGQGSTRAVGYHLGGKVELVRAIVRRHVTDIERIRTQMVSEAAAEVRAERECAL